MPEISAEELARVNSFPKLVALLRDRLEWPIDDDYEFEDVIFEYEPQELGLKDGETAKVREIHQLRPLVTNQPWGVFFISFEEKQLSVTVLRRILRALVVKQRGSTAHQKAWNKSDLIFAANFGESGERELAFVHFCDGAGAGELPVMKVLGWNAKDTKLHNDYAAKMITSRLAWPDDESDDAAWRKQWSSTFEIGHQQVIKTSRDLGLHLAGLATQIRARANELLDAEANDGPMQTMLAAFRKNLIHDLDEDGFADMFAQTICYGMLAAAISREPGALVVDNLADMVPRTNPFLKELFSNFLKLGGRDKRSDLDFDELGVREVVDVLQRADMPAVLRDFGDRNPKEDPVIHFYELFLKEYDPAKRMQRGVFYTPRPVVNFIVRGVDEILRTEFALPLGLADTATWGELAARNEKITVPDHIDPDQRFVQILDPATGTGTFLVEVIDLIHKRMVEHWEGEGKSKNEIAAAWNDYVPAHLLPRLTAFELMMAPYAIAHMKVGLKLTETGYKFGSDERARIFLTNALEPAKDLNMQFDFMSAALAHEAKAANQAKDKVPFTAVIGNPPYANFGRLNVGLHIDELLAPYKSGLTDRKINVGDDYVKFIRFAERSVCQSRYGVVGMITNSSFLDALTLRVMRERLSSDFDTLRFIDLHGNLQRNEVPPDGIIDENVFDIKVGVSISFLARTSHTGRTLEVGDLWGSRDAKAEILLKQSTQSLVKSVQSSAPLFLFKPIDDALQGEYGSLSALQDVMGVNQNCIKTDRDDLFFDIDKSDLENRMIEFFAPDIDPSFVEKFRIINSSSYDIADRREKFDFEANAFHRCAYRPFDVRWLYYRIGLTSRPANDAMQHISSVDNVGLLACRQQATTGFQHASVTNLIAECCSVSGRSREITSVFPLWLKPNAGEAYNRPNVDRKWAQSVGRLIHLTYHDGIPRGEQQSMGWDYRHQKAEQFGLLDEPWDGRGDLEKFFGPRDLFDWIYAILHAPSYRSRYAEFLKSDFPRIPLPKNRQTFAALVRLGRRLVALHLLKPDEELILKNPDIRFAGMGEARVEKGYPKYRNGKVEINANRWFEDVPKETWEFHVGGYQVCEKWLKDRAEKGDPKKDNHRLGRLLTDEDILHYRRTVTALTETRTIMAQIDEAIENHGGWPGAFAIGDDANLAD